AEFSTDAACNAEQFGVRQYVGLTNYVHVQLKVLAQPSALCPLVSKELGHGKPAYRLAQGIGARTDHAGEGRGHLGPKSYRPATLVLEAVELPDNLLAALASVELERLERRPVVFLESGAARNAAPGVHYMGSLREVIGIEVAETGQRTLGHPFNLPAQRIHLQPDHRITNG